MYSKIFPEEASSYKPPADQVAGKKPDIVVLGSTDVPTVQAFMQEFAQDHFTPKMFIAAAGPTRAPPSSRRWSAGNADRHDGAQRLVPRLRQPDQPEDGHRVRRSSTAVRAAGVNADVAEAYSVGQVVQQAITANGSVDNAKIISYLHSGVTLQTVQGTVKFDSLGENANAAAFVFQWQNNGSKFLQVLPPGGGSVPIIATKPAWTS